MSSTTSRESEEDRATDPLDATRREFDFWLGTWDLSWPPHERGTNRISAMYGGRAILEEFDGGPSIDLRGMSVSTVSPETGQWHQTWVDSDGRYLDFRGAFHDNGMVLEREGVVDGEPVRQRMIWRDIAADRLTWRWQRSTDAGRTWRTLWEIKYTRRP